MLAILFAVLIGVYSAMRQYSAFDYTATTFSFLGLATPVFWLALMLQVVFVQIYVRTGHRFFPIANLSDVDPGTASTSGSTARTIWRCPIVVLMVASIAGYSRYMRASMLEVINSDYVRTARAKGLNERKVTMRHAFRNALIPLVTLIALNFGTHPRRRGRDRDGLLARRHGSLLHQRPLANDPYPVMAWLMVTATMIIIFNLIADIAYGLLDPRVRYD